MSKGWSDERRKAQAERCHKQKPWKNSTGPQTSHGKAKSSMNAFKHGGNTNEIKLMKEILKSNRIFLKNYKKYFKNKLIKSQ